MIHEMEPCERESLEWWGMSSLKCESPERGPPSWDLKPGTEVLAEELVVYLAPYIHYICKGWQRSQSPFWVKRLPLPLNGSLGGFSEGNDRWKCSAWYSDTQLALPKQPIFLLSPSLPPAEPKLVCCLNLQRFIHHEHNAYALKWALTFNIVKWGWKYVSYTRTNCLVQWMSPKGEKCAS